MSVTTTAGKIYAAFLRRQLLAAHQWLSPPLAELSLALVGDKRMADLHHQFMSLPGPTDVLTFPLEMDSHGHPVSGEVIVCVPEARRRARAEGTAVNKELLLYALHGLLHLCGFDDRTDAGFAAMHRTEDQILTELGVGPVFAAEPRAPRVTRTPERLARGARPPGDRAGGASRRRRASQDGAD